MQEWLMSKNHELPKSGLEISAEEFLNPPPPVVTLRRQTLAEKMGPQDYEQVVEVTRALIERRFLSMQALNDVASNQVNINPFLMLAMAPAYNIFSPFEAAEYAQNAKMPHGDATAFGRFVEEKIFPIFGAIQPPEKMTRQVNPTAAKLFSPIDGQIEANGTRYLATYKSGPWTMNQSHANEMIQNFPEIYEQTGCDIIIGITYGKKERLNNKPALVQRNTGNYVHILVGQDLWEFVTGVENAHLEIFNAIKEAQRRFAVEHGGKTFFEHLIETRLKLSESFRTAFQLDGTVDDMWEQIFKGSF